MDDPAWTEPLVREFAISTSCQEMAENNHDFAHFQYVHGTESIPDGEERIEGTYKSVKSPGLERETFGLGLGVVRVPGMLDVRFVGHADRPRQRRTCAGSSPCRPMPRRGPATFFAEQFTAGVTQDIPIWENKIYRPLPVLTKSESGHHRPPQLVQAVLLGGTGKLVGRGAAGSD